MFTWSGQHVAVAVGVRETW